MVSSAGADVRLQELVDGLVAKRSIHSVVLGVQSVSGSLDRVVAAGLAGESAPMTPATPYFLASITKMYTAAVIAQLVNAKELDLQTPVQEVLGERVAAIHVLDGVDRSSEVVVDHLLRQTSGLADYFTGQPKGGESLVDDLKGNRDRAIDIEEMLDAARGMRPRFPPGTAGKAFYSDTNYALLGAVIEATVGQPLATVFEERIFRPLSLRHTYLFDHELEQPKPACFYYKDTELSVPLAMSSFGPDGAMVATAGDSLRFLRAFFEGSLFDRPTLESMASGWNRIMFPLSYGAGLMKFKVPRFLSPFSPTPELIGHSGSTGSFAFLSPEHDLYVVGTLNQLDRPSRPFQFMTRVLRAIT